MNQTLRLYEYFLPKHYDLRLTLDREKRRFAGHVVMSGHKPHDTHPLFVHASGLTIKQAMVDDEAVQISPHAHDAIEIGKHIAQGDHTVTLEFSGTISDDMHGLYPCYYEMDGVNHEILVTQFESHHAREVFPCIDEPEAKATFDLTLITESNVTVLSNTPILNAKIQNLKSTTFSTTPRMSTYLLAFVVGELQHTSAMSKNGTKVSVYSAPSQAKSSHDFALAEAVKHLDFFEDYFGITFPLPKCDHVALPDFSAIAMENWGLITYRDGFLMSTDTTPIAQQQYISSVIAHETAHQWFGNLVTMRWWDDLWLNESFANLMQYVALDHAHPGWKVWDDFAELETGVALARDQFAHVQPVRHIVKQPSDLETIFDKAILYSKGSRLLRMAMEHIGEADFRRGLQDYFKTFRYGNTTGKDLWQTLGHASGKHIGPFMETWLAQAGLPVVSVMMNEQVLELTQHRFALGGTVSDTIWPIPLSAFDTHIPPILHDRQHTTHNVVSPQLNINNIGHFMTHYDEPSFTRMVELLDTGNLSSVERGALLYETYLLCQSSHYETSRLFSLLRHFRNETSSSVWNIMGTILATLRIMVGEGSKRSHFDRYVLWLTQTLYESLGGKMRGQDTMTDKKTRAIICNLRLLSHDQQLINELGNHTISPKADSDAEMLYATYVAVVQRGDKTTIDALIALHQTTHDSHLRSTIGRALTTSSDQSLLRTCLGWLDTPAYIKPQDVPWWYGGMMLNPQAREMTWTWLTRHWDWLVDTYRDGSMLDRFISSSAHVMTADDWLERYDEFVSTPPQLASHRAISIGRDEIKAKISWLMRDRVSIINGLTTSSARDTINS